MGVGAEPASEVRGSARKTIARDASTQTVYRDSETQTTPYTPAYAISPGTQPEILELATLTSSKVASACTCVMTTVNVLVCWVIY